MLVITSHRCAASHVVRTGLCFLLVLTAKSSVEAALFEFQGVGINRSNTQGVVGETVTVSFAYDTDDWTLITKTANYARWKPSLPIVMDIVGSASGNNFQILPVVSVEATNSPFTTWDFSTGTATSTHGSLWRLDAFLQNSQFDVAIPNSFKVAHQIVVEELTAGNIWEGNPFSYAMGTDFIVDPPIINIDLLILQDFHWQITRVPEPQTVCLALLAAAALVHQQRMRGSRLQAMLSRA